MISSPDLLFSEPYIVIPEDYDNGLSMSESDNVSQTEFHIVIPEQYQKQLDSCTHPSTIPLLGELLQKAGLVSNQQILLAVEEQQRGNNLRIGEILASYGWISPKTADFFVQKWDYFLNTVSPHPIGYYLQQASLLDEGQIDQILTEQSKRHLRFGEIAIAEGFIKKQTLEFFLSHFGRKNATENV
ncbi:MAG: hypothetical protein AB4058_17380 [Microcystaceae cyanobacterium]